jgi:ketosteroid isomerase-like protein
MRRLGFPVVFALLTLGAVIAAQGVAQTLIDQEQQWTKAAKANDVNVIAPLLADDFVMMDSDGSMHAKAEVLALAKKAKWGTFEIGDIKVVVHGDSAVVTGSWTGKGTDGNGKAVDAKERWVDTWIKTASGKWQCVASASAPTK